MANPKGRPVSKPITSDFVKFLMGATRSETLTELEASTGIKLTTLRGWAFQVNSPWQALELVCQLTESTGLSPRELLERLQHEDQERAS